MKTILKLIKITLISAFVLTACPVNAFAEVSNFTKVNEYTGNFTDIKDTDWFKEDVISSFETGLLKGKETNTFDPYGNLTLAEAITLAARVNNIYNGNSSPIENNNITGPWYQPYVDYAVENGLMMEGEFRDFEKIASRAEVAYVFCNTLGKENLYNINNITSIPDVDKDTLYHEEIFTLYNSGIVAGSDKYGTFNPDSFITRAEASAIVNRVADEEKRISARLVNDKDHVLINEIDGFTVTSFSPDEQYIASQMIKGKYIINLNGHKLFDQKDTRNERVELLKDFILSANIQNPLILGVDSFVYNDVSQLLTVNYTYDLEEKKVIQDAVKEKVEEIAGEILKPGMSYIEREIAINNYLVSSIEYDKEAADQLIKYGKVDEKYYNSFNAYGALIEGIAVCEGYSEAFKLLCDRAGIDCIIVTGELDGVGHAWNRVRINDKWYDVDVTNNDKEEMANSHINIPMAISDQYLREDSYYITDDNFGELERGTSEQYEYYNYMGKYVEKDNIYDYILENIKKYDYVTFRTSSDYTMDSLKKTLNRVLNNISGRSSLTYITNVGVVYVESKR
ncbi:MAG: S-layer homology domain-containing protein [Sedimentibacter saalensis]|uniref:S-layer homology domain-containing protein n=1 Tax=Sedimentibacter saalensis TaxID=130788 RepID=UPI002B20134D|nr:S-layer homology domain-containing protein [Sedimentibacter saalensis]MEA5093925.1 S-layer homology domain-containing protein [Sedimentibacter saalensis]